MYILMISRGVPTPEHPQWGCFEKDQAEALAAYGHKVVVASVDARFEKNRGPLGLHHTSKNGVDYYNYTVVPSVFYTKFMSMLFYMKHIKPLMMKKVYKRILKEQGRPDVVYAQFFFNGVVAASLKKFIKAPLVTIEHLSNFGNGQLNKYMIDGARYAYGNSDKIVAVSDFLKNKISSFTDKEIEVCPNVLPNEFNNLNIEKIKQSKKFKFVACGSLIDRKGFDLIIKAASQIKDISIDWSVDIIGEGPDRAKLNQMINDLGLDNKIKLVGKLTRNQIQEHYKSADAFILSSRSETFGVVVIEALASGLPCIVTDCGGTQGLISDTSGIMVPVDDASAIAMAMEKMLRGERKFNNDEIRRDSLERFSSNAVAKKLTEIFERVGK